MKKISEPSSFAKKEIGAIIKQRRKERGLSQEDVGQKARTDQSTVSRTENGKGDRFASTLFQIAKVLGLSEEEINRIKELINNPN